MTRDLYEVFARKERSEPLSHIGTVRATSVDFAKVYAACMDAGNEELDKLRKLSPARCTLWKRILEGE